MVLLSGTLLEAFDFLQLALSTNWFGLGCPYHCGQSTLPPIFLAFTIGTFIGFASCAFLCGLFIRYLLPASAQAAQGLSCMSSCEDIQQLTDRVALLELQLADLTSAFNQFRLASRNSAIEALQTSS